MNGMYLYDRRCAGEEKNMETKNLSESTVCCFGFSGGVYMTLYLDALDPRVRKAFVSGYLYGVDD